MGEDDAEKTESRAQSPSVPVDSATSPPQVQAQPEKDHSPEHSVIPLPKEKLTSPVVQKVAGPPAKKDSGDSVDRDSLLARVEREKRLALIKAWEDSEKTKSENKAYKKLSAVGLWEDWKKASVEARLKKIEENLEKKKAEYVEKMKNKMAEIHQSAEGKRAMVEAQRKEEFLKVEETAAKFRSSGFNPRKLLACFRG